MCRWVCLVWVSGGRRQPQPWLIWIFLSYVSSRKRRNVSSFVIFDIRLGRQGVGSTKFDTVYLLCVVRAALLLPSGVCSKSNDFNPPKESWYTMNISWKGWTVSLLTGPYSRSSLYCSITGSIWYSRGSSSTRGVLSYEYRNPHFHFSSWLVFMISQDRTTWEQVGS